LARFKNALPGRDDLRTARRDFEPFVTALTDLAREQHLTSREGLHVYECPMSPVLGLARWLSRTPEPKNPFFGSAMPECGDELN
jgi:Cu(I)/Ag(I) efflux system membrane fusion protein